MKLAALFSGGKDSTFALYKAISEGHKIKYLVSIFSKNPDSYMYHTENINLVKFQSQALGIPLIVEGSLGEKEKELLDLKNALLRIKNKIDGVITGAIQSEYQKSRIKKICNELNLKVISPLWKKDPEEIFHELLKLKFEVIITSVKAEGFSKEWLGKKIDLDGFKKLKMLSEKYRFNLGFDGGEAETLVLDMPLFKKRLKIIEAKKEWDGIRGVYKIKKIKLVDKIV